LTRQAYAKTSKNTSNLLLCSQLGKLFSGAQAHEYLRDRLCMSRRRYGDRPLCHELIAAAAVSVDLAGENLGIAVGRAEPGRRGAVTEGTWTGICLL
jgi:hypothetical protein